MCHVTVWQQCATKEGQRNASIYECLCLECECATKWWFKYLLVASVTTSAQRREKLVCKNLHRFNAPSSLQKSILQWTAVNSVNGINDWMKCAGKQYVTSWLIPFTMSMVKDSICSSNRLGQCWMIWPTATRDVDNSGDSPVRWWTTDWKTKNIGDVIVEIYSFLARLSTHVTKTYRLHCYQKHGGCGIDLRASLAWMRVCHKMASLKIIYVIKSLEVLAHCII